MTDKRTIERDDWILTRDGDTIEVSRSCHSDWLDVPVKSIPQFIDDLRAISASQPSAPGGTK